MKTLVYIERGKYRGQYGTIAGRLADRLNASPPREKALVTMWDSIAAETIWTMVRCSDIREASEMEITLLGLSS